MDNPQKPYIATRLTRKEYDRRVANGTLYTYGYDELVRQLNEEDQSYKTHQKQILDQWCEEHGIITPRT